MRGGGRGRDERGRAEKRGSERRGEGKRLSEWRGKGTGRQRKG